MGTSTTIPYPYAPLDASSREIRVLKLEPGEFSDPITISISTVSLDDQPVFNALSYVWGDTSDVRPVYVDGHGLAVTTNLESALRHLRSHPSGLVDATALPLWVDAICIQQSNMDERSHQVRLMGDVYRSANRVLAWLGEGNDETDWLFDSFNDHESRARLQAPSSKDRWRALWIAESDIFSRPWWTRTWIIQEVVLPTEDPIVICGTRAVAFSVCTMMWDLSVAVFDEVRGTKEFLRFWSFVNTLPGCPPRRHGNMVTFHFWREYRARDGFIRLGAALSMLNRSLATNPADLVYGVLGMIPPDQASRITVDYNRDYQAVLKEAMTVIWETDMGRSVTPSEFYFGGDGDRCLPSWVPTLVRRSPDPRAIEESGGVFFMGKKSLPGSLVAKISGDVLFLEGFRFEHVSRIYTSLIEDIGNPISLRRLADDLGAFRNDVLRAQAEPIEPNSPISGLGPLREAESLQEIFTDWGARGSPPETSGEIWGILTNDDGVGIPDFWQRTDRDGRLWVSPVHPIINFIAGMAKRAGHRKLFITENGFVGLGMSSIQPGDLIVLIPGSWGPFLLRPNSKPGGYRITGQAYVGGLMDGKILGEHIEACGLEKVTFEIH